MKTYYDTLAKLFTDMADRHQKIIDDMKVPEDVLDRMIMNIAYFRRKADHYKLAAERAAA
jgi:hypothetical protein